MSDLLRGWAMSKQRLDYQHLLNDCQCRNRTPALARTQERSSAGTAAAQIPATGGHVFADQQE
jgi:hypothetical protein